MKYRITRRGWIVFSTLGVILIFSIFSLITNLTPDVYDSADDPIQEIVDPVNQENDVSEEVTEQPAEVESDETEVEAVKEVEDEAVDSEPVTEVIVEVDMDRKTDILFEKNVSELDKEYYGVLVDWAEILFENETLTIVIEGHVNGYPYYNDKEFAKSLSMERAVVVKQFLIDLGINAERLEVKVIGSQDQVSKDDIENQHLNRRAVIYFKKP